MDLGSLKLNEECRKCIRLKVNGGTCEGKKNGNPCIAFKELKG